MGESPLETIGSVELLEEDYEEDGFSSLEERIFEVDGKDYEYTYIRAHLDQFIYSALKIVSGETGANKPTTIARTIEHGLWVLRNEGVLDKARGVSEITLALMRLTADDIENIEVADSVDKAIESHSVDVGGVSGENMTEAVNLKVKDSIYSESVDAYTDSIFSSKAMIMRTLLSAGITDSEQRMGRSMSMAQEQVDAFAEQIEEAQAKIEMELFKYLLTKKVVWEERGINDYEREQMDIIADNVQTDYGERVVAEVENSDVDFP